MANTNDLRYLRTEASIRSAFMELVAAEPITSVTASAVCRQAGISRNAFYLHHASVPALYAALLGELIEDVREQSLASAELRAATGHDDEYYKTLIEALARHEALLRALLPSDDGTLAKRLAEGLEEGFIAAARRFGEHGTYPEHRLRCAYSGWALVGLVTQWIAQEERPLTDALALFEELHAGATEAAAHYLMDTPAPASLS